MSSVDLHMDAIEEMFHDPDGPVGQIMEHKAENVENAMKALLALPGAGAYYWTVFYTDKKGHVHPTDIPGLVEHASAPGAPASSTSEHHYLDSLFTQIIETDEGVGYNIGSFWFVARLLEHGTKHMPARPLMRPALDIGVNEP